MRGAFCRWLWFTWFQDLFRKCSVHFMREMARRQFPIAPATTPRTKTTQLDTPGVKSLAASWIGFKCQLRVSAVPCVGKHERIKFRPKLCRQQLVADTTEDDNSEAPNASQNAANDEAKRRAQQFLEEIQSVFQSPFKNIHKRPGTFVAKGYS